LHRQTTDMHARHLARSRTCTGRFVFRSQDMHQCGSLCHVAHTTLHQNDYTHKPVSDIVNHTAQMHTHPNDPSRNSPSHTCKEVGCELGVPAQAHWNWVWVSFDNLPQTKINHFDLMIWLIFVEKLWGKTECCLFCVRMRRDARLNKITGRLLFWFWIGSRRRVTFENLPTAQGIS